MALPHGMIERGGFLVFKHDHRMSAKDFKEAFAFSAKMEAWWAREMKKLGIQKNRLLLK